MTERELLKMAATKHYLDKDKIFAGAVRAHTVSQTDRREIMFRKKHISALLIAVLAVCLCTATVFAISRLLGAKEAAQAIAVPQIAAAFASKGAMTVNESVTDAGYTVTFLGLATGKDLEVTDAPQDKSYAVVAIARADGAPMPDVGSTPFFVSPLINGLDPALYNIVTMNGSFSERVIEGILYRMIACDSVELFADHGLSLCVTETGFYEQSAFRFDEAEGGLLPSDDYAGLNVLFRLPIDPGKADPVKAEAYLASLFDEKEPAQTDADSAAQEESGFSMPTSTDGDLDMQALSDMATPLEASRQVLKKNAQNCFVYSYDGGDDGSINLTLFETQYEGKQPGVPFLGVVTSSDDGVQTRNWYLVFTMQDKDTVEGVIYEAVQ